MTVNNSWLVNVSVSINNTVIQPPNFNNCAIVAVMNGVPSRWSPNDYYVYTDLATFLTDFTLLYDGSVTSNDYNQALFYQWAINAGTAFFAQSPTPVSLTVFSMEAPRVGTNYETLLLDMSIDNNNFYGFSICNRLTAGSYSYVIMSVTTAGAAQIASGTALTPTTATSAYVTQNNFSLPSAGTYFIPFFSTDVTTAIAASTFTAISPTVSGVSVAQPDAAQVGVPGYLTSTDGVIPGLIALRSASNQKKMFGDFDDFNQPHIIQDVGSQDLTCFYHSLNFGDMGDDLTQEASLAAACMGKYFTSLFKGSNGLTILSSMQLSSTPKDPTINTSNIGTPGDPGSTSSLINWNNNVYPGFGSSNLGLVQYGFQSNSQPSNQIYLDQVVGADYVQFAVQAALVTLILNSLPSGLPYSDLGIQQIVNTFKNALQSAVSQNILQPFANSAIVATPYAQVSSTDITNRVYKDLSFTGKFLSRIQMIQVFINLSI